MTEPLYTLPKLYHAAFSWDLSAEIEFYAGLFDRSPFPVRTLLEPACGSGRYFPDLEKAGFSVTGYDLSPEMTDFAQALIRGHKLEKCRAFVGDMATFRTERIFDGAVNPVNSFRYLLSDDAILSHLRNTAAMLRPDAYYIVEFCYAFLDPGSAFDLNWSTELEGEPLHASWTVMEENHESRISLERSRISWKGHCSEELHRTRLWTQDSFMDILKKVPEFQLEAVFDQEGYEVLSPSLYGEMGNLHHLLRRV